MERKEGVKNKDLRVRRYRVNDCSAYGLYNGISEFDLEGLVEDVFYELHGKQLSYFDRRVLAEEVATILNRDEELKQIALNTYQADPEHTEWSEEYRNWFRKAAMEKKAPGWCIIPNHIVRAKIADILVRKIEEENAERRKEKEKIENLLEIARKTGRKQLICQWTEGCNDPNEECVVDVVSEWAMPDGSIQRTRTHTW